jgi:hypothetical protein
MAIVQLFSVQFGSLNLCCARDMAQGLYILSSQDSRCGISPDDASRLAGVRSLLQWRGRVAIAKNRPMKVGPVFKRAWPLLTVEIGINSSGDAVYVQVNDLRADLDEGQMAILMAVLDQLAADLAVVSQATAGPPDLTIVQGLRGWLLPWEVDPSW